MDLTIPVGESKLNIRVAVLAKTKNGYLLEKHPSGYLYFIGGRVKINEDSEKAAKREIMEEIGIKIDNLSFKTTIENFYFSEKGVSFHEICFVYEISDELELSNLPSVLVECPVHDFINQDIRPQTLKDYILNKDQNPHMICKDINKCK